ncbi:hypothetical protein PF002_g12736 [Phytophthora fragariae]|uniref:BRCT domain-containing protein n=1 Tax=Phytophthora fragariae TaxID=53985 RepID=A0A6A3KQH8_9STRA|nr:hypothetical protein PF011_g10220 [Phytophthora fragariae]KAE9231319.1 hypothetical protein PF002_g12736 [Phytophthora fragariae]KAE9309477.1 hypothetical protein PF001_g10667 [Phytophthora fragariae]
MVAAVSVSLSAGPRSTRMTTRTAPRPRSAAGSVASASSRAAKTSSTSSAPVRRRPRTASTAGPLKGVVAMVDVRVGADAQIDCSDVVARKLRELGASTVKRVTPKLTHMVLSHYTPAWKTKIAKWQAGGGSMAAAATRYELKIVSQLWVNACYVSKKRMDERPFFPVSQQSVAGAVVSTAKPKLKRRQSLGADAPKAASETTETQEADNATKTTNTKKTDTGTNANVAAPSTPPPKINKALNGARRKRRAHSMEPMTSDAILKMLGSTEPAPEATVLSTPTQPIRQRTMSSSAKRRKTLNGPPTQQDEDEITASQVSGIVAESDSENEQDEEEEAQRSEVIVILDSQASPAPLERKQESSGVLTGSSSTPTASGADFSIGTPDDSSAKKEPTARELRRRNRNSLSYGGGLTLKSASKAARKLPTSATPSSAMKLTHSAAKKRARPPVSGNMLTTPVVKKARRDNNKENTVDGKHMATPGSVSGFSRKYRDLDSTPIPMAMSFSSTTNRTTPRNTPRNVIGITGVSPEARGVLQCAIHAIDANMANGDGHRKARVVKSVDYSAGVTHLIVGKDARRTIKVLFAIARGAWIVTEDWAFSSLEQERWLPEADFEITMFANKYSREHPESRQIFKGMKFFVGSNVEPSREVLQSLIQVSGGEICKQISVADICICGDASLFRRAQRTGTRVVTSKWVFDSIATMKLEDDSKYTFTDSFGTFDTLRDTHNCMTVNRAALSKTSVKRPGRRPT